MLKIVLWAEGTISVRSPRTAHYVGQDHKVIPIFPLRPHLDETHQLASDASEFVISRYRKSNINLRTQFDQIVKRAALTPGPRLSRIAVDQWPRLRQPSFRSMYRLPGWGNP